MTLPPLLRPRRPHLPQEARPQDARGQGALRDERAQARPARPILRPPARGEPGRVSEHLATCAAATIDDAAEEKLVTAIAVAMWNEIRADRTLVETMAEIPPCRPGRSHGSDMADPGTPALLGTAIRYMTAAGMATQRAQRAFLAHRKAKKAGLILPAAPPELRIAQTNSHFAAVRRAGQTADARVAIRTNELPATTHWRLAYQRSPNAQTNSHHRPCPPPSTKPPPATAAGGAGAPGARPDRSAAA